MEPLTIAAGLGVLAVVAGLAALVASRVTSRDLVLVHHDGGLEVPGSRPVAVLLLVALLAAVLFPAPLLVALVLGRGDVGSTTMVAVALAVPLLAAPVLLGLVRGRYHLNRLRLTPDAVEVHSYRAPTVVRWDDLAEVVRTSGSGGRWVLRATSPEAVRRPRAGSLGERSVNPGLATDVDLQTGLLRGGEQVVGLVRHFLAHPTERAGLGAPMDQSSLDDITGGRNR